MPSTTIVVVDGVSLRLQCGTVTLIAEEGNSPFGLSWEKWKLAVRVQGCFRALYDCIFAKLLVNGLQLRFELRDEDFASLVLGKDAAVFQSQLHVLKLDFTVISVTSSSYGKE